MEHNICVLQQLLPFSISGGWLKVAEFVTKNYENFQFDITTVLYDDPAVALERVANHNHTSAAISFTGLVKLRKTMGFSQMRFRCRRGKEYIDISTTNDKKGKPVVDFFTSDEIINPDACGSIYASENSKFTKN